MTIAHYLLAPWWAAQLATGAKSFRDNPLIGSRRLNARGLHVSRVRLAHALAERRRARLAHLIDPADRAAFDRDGFLLKRDFLPADAFAALRDAVFARQSPAREMVQGDTITRRIALDPAFLAAVPEARALLRHPLWRGAIRYAGSFDAEPLAYVQTILARRHDAAPDPQTDLHADTFHPTVKAWLFLTDVAEEDGPFRYVPGSHRLTPGRLAFERETSLAAPHGVDRLSSRGSFRVAEAALAGMGLPPARSFATPANTLVVADTFGFHARQRATRPSTRVEIWAYGRRNPFLPWTGLDLLGAPGIAERRVPLLWQARDVLERMVGQPWRDVGRKRPCDS
ncbi:phytanoyl-CoA dioxygenase family protein [Sphingomonas profundi]|uniref:phytanoyl-CoA dioxygenase family protein n=1 Tax=Alterirhizorhabdus profundi TaxID=2681549 RepID=UPI0012E7E2D9|nr:phytanoyl-CoA dioxygenase family protein [Sphingomonas profundi]